MINIIRDLLAQKLNDIDAGNSNISESEQEELINILAKINKKELNKLEAAEYLGVSVSTFNNYVGKGLIPKGIKRSGSTLVWDKNDLQKYVK